MLPAHRANVMLLRNFDGSVQFDGDEAWSVGIGLRFGSEKGLTPAQSGRQPKNVTPKRDRSTPRRSSGLGSPACRKASEMSSSPLRTTARKFRDIP